MPKNKEPSKEQIKEQLWRMGELAWKLKGKQKDLHDYIINNPKDVSVALCTRRGGKSFTLCTLATETCIKEPNSIVKYACPKARMVATIIKPIMRIILSDCPEDMKPEWMAQDKVYRFPNGSEIQIAGTDNGNAENLRGGYAQLLVLDEAGFMDDLEYIVNSILLPTTDTTDGHLAMASTPNYKDPQHEFHENFVFPEEAANNVFKFTIHESPMVDVEKIKKIIARYPGGEENPKFRCEYLCEIPKSSESSVVPEFSALKDEIVTDNYPKPPCRDFYVSFDIGFKDLTVGLFGYYDFKEAKLVIMDELVANGPEMTTEFLANKIKHLEQKWFYDEETAENMPPYMRVMDNDLKLINDLGRLHELLFIPTAKDNKEAAINGLRMWVANKRLVIHPRCKHLIYHIENASWDKQRKGFKHLKDSISANIRGGHADALDALIYLVRNLNEHKNPYPHDFNELKGPNIWRAKKKDDTSSLQGIMNTIFNIRKK